MDLAVVTHTNPLWQRDISRCVQSVSDALNGVNGKHYIIELSDSSKFQEARYDAMKLADVVVFVDDDDYISSNSLFTCMQAIENAGCVFTDEVFVEDQFLSIKSHKTQYESIGVAPDIIHHMCAIRTSVVSNKSYELATKYGCGIEWIMKAEAAFAGAIHIPEPFYYWVQHKEQHHRSKEWHELFAKNISDISAELLIWNKLTGSVPEFR